MSPDISGLSLRVFACRMSGMWVTAAVVIVVIVVVNVVLMVIEFN